MTDDSSRAVCIGLHDEESVLPANYIVRQEVEIRRILACTETEFADAVDLLAGGVVRPGSDWLEERPLGDGSAAFTELVCGACGQDRPDRGRVICRLTIP